MSSKNFPVCVLDHEGNHSLCADCSGEAFGPLLADHCGQCDSNASYSADWWAHLEQNVSNDWSNDCRLDCNGVWGGGAEPNPCGVCDGDVSICFTWGCDGIEGEL
eukprot:SAG22_NODE_3226_length_1845_cov_2.332188_3_plen_105_part_00